MNPSKYLLKIYFSLFKIITKHYFNITAKQLTTTSAVKSALALSPWRDGRASGEMGYPDGGSSHRVSDKGGGIPKYITRGGNYGNEWKWNRRKTSNGHSNPYRKKNSKPYSNISTMVWNRPSGEVIKPLHQSGDTRNRWRVIDTSV